MVLSLSPAQELAASSIQDAQKMYKMIYDWKAVSVDYRGGDWMLVKFLQEESGKNRKLSRLYRVIVRDHPYIMCAFTSRPTDSGAPDTHNPMPTRTTCWLLLV